MTGLQVLLPAGDESVRVAGLPVILRAAQRAAELSPAKVALAGAAPGFAQRWSRQLASFEDFPVLVEGGVEEGKPLLVVSAEGLPGPGALAGFVSRTRGRVGRWLHEGRVVAVYLPSGAPAGTSAAAALSSVPRFEDAALETAPGEWHDARRGAFAREAESALYRSLGKADDGFIARFDRALSGAVSRRLLRTPVTPNQITLASLLIGVAGSALIGTGVYRAQALGAVLLWTCCILDGCDGEVARLKLLCSKRGAWLDVACDNVAHLATFTGIAVGVWRAEPTPGLAWAGALLVSGVALSMFWVWRLGSAVALFVERVASRDYVYLVSPLVLLGKLSWFFWAAAVGSHLFWLGLLLASRRRPTP